MARPAPVAPVSPFGPAGPVSGDSVPGIGTCGDREAVDRLTGRHQFVRHRVEASVRTNFALIDFAPNVNSRTVGSVSSDCDQATHGSLSSRPS